MKGELNGVIGNGFIKGVDDEGYQNQRSDQESESKKPEVENAEKTDADSRNGGKGGQAIWPIPEHRRNPLRNMEVRKSSLQKSESKAKQEMLCRQVVGDWQKNPVKSSKSGKPSGVKQKF